MSNDLLNEFIFDARDHLSTAGLHLLDLEKDPSSLEALNALMGTMHTIKGTSGFLDLHNLYGLLHHGESLLQTVREKQCACPQKIVDLLLQVLDTVEALLDRLERGGDDSVEWLEALKQSLAAAEAQLELSSDCRMEESGPEPSAAAGPGSALKPEAEARLAQPTKYVIKDNLSGKISLITLADGQLAEEDELFPARVAAMFEAGLAGLIIDLRSVVNLSSRELKVLICAARKKPEQTAFLITENTQQSLYRVFQVINLDKVMHFFPEREAALAYIKNNR